MPKQKRYIHVPSIIDFDGVPNPVTFVDGLADPVSEAYVFPECGAINPVDQIKFGRRWHLDKDIVTFSAQVFTGVLVAIEEGNIEPSDIGIKFYRKSLDEETGERIVAFTEYDVTEHGIKCDAMPKGMFDADVAANLLYTNSGLADYRPAIAPIRYKGSKTARFTVNIPSYLDFPQIDGTMDFDLDPCDTDVYPESRFMSPMSQFTYGYNLRNSKPTDPSNILTTSDRVLSGISTAIHDGKMNAADVQIRFIERDRESIIQLGEDGSPLQWPAGMMDLADQVAANLKTAIAGRVEADKKGKASAEHETNTPLISDEEVEAVMDAPKVKVVRVDQKAAGSSAVDPFDFSFNAPVPPFIQEAAAGKR